MVDGAIKPMELQIHFKGTPAEFGVAIGILENNFFLAGNSPLFCIVDSPKPDANPVYIELYDPSPERRYIGGITAQKVPTGSILFVQAKDEYWSYIQPTWTMIREALEEQGWIDPIQPSSSARNKSGRPRNPHDDWAWEQVNMRAQDRRTVFSEWQRRNQEHGRILSDEIRSFRHAIHPGRYERKKMRKPE